MRRLTLLLLMLAVAFIWPQTGRTETTQEMRSIKDDLRTLTEGQTAIERDIQEIRILLGVKEAQHQSEFKEAVIDIKGAPFKGAENSKIVIVEFSDFRCSWCGRFVRDTFPQFAKEYIQTDKIKYVFFDFPMNTTTFKAAEAGHCAKEQGKFWEMHDRLFANQNALDAKDLINHAEAIGLDMPVFRKCLETGKYSAGVAEEREIGRNLGVNGTPTFFLGFPESWNKLRVVKMLKGGRFEALKDAVDGYLSPQVK